jgi:serine phosphatase RsbU (regulator of sigma subunit)/anti-sigma regulatory factor (Ser/Thr protein kinase)
MTSNWSQTLNLDPDVLVKVCEAIPRGVLIASHDGRIIHINQSLIDALTINRDLEIGKSLARSRIFGDNRQNELKKLVEEGRSIEFTNRLTKGDEDRYWTFRGNIFPGGFLVEGEDVTQDRERLENAEVLGRKYEKQIEIAQRLQRDLFPPNFQKKRIDVSTHLIMAQDLAGDFFSISELSPNAIGVVIGDVVGKGIPASLMAMSIHTMFTQEAKLLRSPNELLSLVNRMLHNRFKGDFWYATAFYAKILVSNLSVTYARAGHEFPLLYRAKTGQVEELAVEGLPLGMFANSFYQTQKIDLEDNDRLLLFTDGLPDATNPAGDRFGHDKVIELLKKHGRKSSGEIIDIYVREVERFCDGSPYFDDIALALFSVVPDMWTTWEIPPRTFDELLDSISCELEEAGADEDTIWDIRLALDECIINAQKHGNMRSPDLPVYICYLINPHRAIFQVSDNGEGFEYEHLPDPTLEPQIMSEYGRGVYITREVMDEVEFNERGNEITITKNLSKKP